jgi:RHH-type transcriptional regulator, proline utilization regulon repressor / proline dehydrogenase / delta 1-pyrroline-5-carboxylate dehydrogenase
MTASAPSELRARIPANHRLPEAQAIAALRARAALPHDAETRIAERALGLAARVRAAPRNPWSAEAFLRHHGLSTAEGVALMCVAEALLRIPDAETADALLREKLGSGRWSDAPEDGSLMASAADLALMLTGTLARWAEEPDEDLAARVRRIVARLGEPVVRSAVRQAMRLLAEQFVLAETIEGAAKAAAERRPLRFSYDMLGEAARSAEDATRYFDSYVQAMRSVAVHNSAGPVTARDGISVKLSALHPRFEEAKRARVFAELLPRIRSLARLARDATIGLTLDAEESERLELTLDLLEALAGDRELAGWNGLGLAVQAYQKRAPAVCDWLVALARGARRRLAVRLVKGAYWDSEIKRAQVLGMADYPVYTRKAATDVSYLACARALLSAQDAIYPAFATHNSRSVATILELAGGSAEFEFQRLLGMGEALYDMLAAETAAPCRIYAPVGNFNELLPYLVRRLLENGANTSFVHQIADPAVPLEALVADPLAQLPDAYEPDARIPLPRALYPGRANSLGVDLARRDELAQLAALTQSDRAAAQPAPAASAREPGNLACSVGAPAHTARAQLDAALARASIAFEEWSIRPAAERAAVLERAADAFESQMRSLVSIVVREGGRTYADAVAEVREAADFCRYYALEARTRFAAPLLLPGPAGERNTLALHGRGVFACISPWNFPLAIFTGQVAAALAAGNAVLAKPAEQTPLTASRALSLLHAAGVPADAAIGVFGDGETLGAPLVADPRVGGVAFTGSVETARAIERALAARSGPIVPLIAETGGLNAMLVDSSALPEQVVDDVIVSAFQSAGQRCSALRILFVEAGCAPRVLSLLAGAMRELKLGDPVEPDTDVGPIIDPPARAALLAHVARLRASAQLVGEAPVPAGLPEGHWLAPVAFEVALEALPRSEIFGPVLHVCVLRRGDLERALAWIRASGYGLTLGIHSRVQRFVDRVVQGTRVGNVYVNRSMIGAVVGVQPFGGEGLSGTGFKAGGPNYLLRFATERTLSVNTAAIGGVTELLQPGARLV